jgi:3-dehydroquinate synthase
MMSKQEVILSEDLAKHLKQAMDQCPHDRLFVLTDEHTSRLCMPRLREIDYLSDMNELVIGSGDMHKTLDTLASVWQWLSDRGATRHSLLINLGGGMVTDLGGFAAATFKRGFPYINVPTTLLAMVDASVGGKTGINFNGLKNEVGVFAPASVVLIDTRFLRTLDRRNLLSGYAEMLKHGLISTEAHWAELLRFDPEQADDDGLRELVGRSVQVKEEIVAQDPFEQGVRKALNLGHTVGHAFESLALEESRPVLHGYAVAWGMVCELHLSHIKAGFPAGKMRQTVAFIKENYGAFPIDCKQYDTLHAFMLHDKKNTAGVINFTLLEDVGKITINQTAGKDTIFTMFDFYRECMGI